jgi:epoxyqueuosine reductase
VADICGRTIHGRVCVDTAPLLEREAARRAGLGFIGKSNLLIMPGLGSHVLLGALLLDVEIAIDAPMDQRCGRCTACLDACPTQAFVGPFVLDARRCISYLTIEYRGWIDRALRPLMGTHVFGCDVCQDICPYNHGKDPSPMLALNAREATLPNVELSTWLTLTSSGYRRLSAGTALRRASRWQLLRNAAIAAGNSGDLGLVDLLVRLLADSKYPIVRGHAAWALGHLGNSNAILALQTAFQREHESAVLEEIEHALRNSPRAL